MYRDEHGNVQIKFVVSWARFTKTARFEVLTRALLKIQVFWDATLCRWASSSRRFEASSCVYFHSQAAQEELLGPEDERIMSFRNVGNY